MKKYKRVWTFIWYLKKMKWATFIHHPHYDIISHYSEDCAYSHLLACLHVIDSSEICCFQDKYNSISMTIALHVYSIGIYIVKSYQVLICSIILNNCKLWTLSFMFICHWVCICKIYIDFCISAEAIASKVATY